MSIRAAVIGAAVLLASGGFSACSLIDGAPLVERRPDAGPKDGAAPNPDAGSDAALDADTGTDAVPDTDAGTDAALDTDVGTDAALDSDAETGAAPDVDASSDAATDHQGFVPRPAGYWSFDVLDIDGNPVDDLDGLHPVSIDQGSLGGGKVGSGVVLQGGTAVATIANDPAFEPLTNATVSFWAMADALPGMMVDRNPIELFSKGTSQHDWDVFINAFNFITISVGNGFTATGPAMTVGEWTHIAMVYQNGSFALLYVNGRFENSTSVDVPRGPATAPITLGNGSWLTDLGFQGRIDEVAVWHAALTSDQIIVLYARGLEGRKLTD